MTISHSVADGEDKPILNFHEFGMLFDGKKSIVRISPKFVTSARIWNPGDELKIRLPDLIDRMKKDLQRWSEGEWFNGQPSICSFDHEKGHWYIHIIFAKKNGDHIPMIANMDGKIWSIGERYDEFDNP